MIFSQIDTPWEPFWEQAIQSAFWDTFRYPPIKFSNKNLSGANMSTEHVGYNLSSRIVGINFQRKRFVNILPQKFFRALQSEVRKRLVMAVQTPISNLVWRASYVRIFLNMFETPQECILDTLEPLQLSKNRNCTKFGFFRVFHTPDLAILSPFWA